VASDIYTNDDAHAGREEVVSDVAAGSDVEVLRDAA